jgi:hypothetical protein
MFLRCNLRLFPAVAIVLMAATAWPQNPGATQPALTAAQIVDQMQRHNQARAAALKHYESLRHYQVEYRGFAVKLEAAMDVEVNFDAKSGKSFRIVKQSGSKALGEKVLKRAVDSEKEASQAQAASALTAANYRFGLVGNEDLGGRPTYVLEVEPLTPSKFLYRGKVWVDAADFALVKIDAEPAKNPSFWISRTLIRQSFAKSGDFWLPRENRSETKVRVGGTAVFTVDYGTYTIEASRIETSRIQ